MKNNDNNMKNNDNNMTVYDKNNIFARIIAGQIPAEIIFKSKNTLIFKDNNPQAKVHFLVIPLGDYINYTDFIANADKDKIIEFFHLANKIANQYTNGSFKLQMNTGVNSGQEVFHFHMHILSNDVRNK